MRRFRYAVPFTVALVCSGLSRGPEQPTVTANVTNANQRNREALSSIQPL